MLCALGSPVLLTSTLPPLSAAGAPAGGEGIAGALPAAVIEPPWRAVAATSSLVAAALSVGGAEFAECTAAALSGRGSYKALAHGVVSAEDVKVALKRSGSAGAGARKPRGDGGGGGDDMDDALLRQGDEIVKAIGRMAPAAASTVPAPHGDELTWFCMAALARDSVDPLVTRAYHILEEQCVANLDDIFTVGRVVMVRAGTQVHMFTCSLYFIVAAISRQSVLFLRRHAGGRPRHCEGGGGSQDAHPRRLR